MQPNLMSAIRQIASERGLELAQVVEILKQALASGFRNQFPEEMGVSIEVEIDPDAETIEAYADKKVVEEVVSPPTQISLKEAQKIEPRLKIGDHVLVEITHTGDFGRVAAQAARQVVMQGLRELEKESIFAEIEGKIGTVETATIQRIDREGNVFAEVQRAIAKMPPEEQIKTEFYKIPSRVKVFLKKIQVDAKGKILIISRSDKDFLKALFEVEVPEVASGTVEIMEIAREAGSRSKVAVRSNAAGVDPIGACIGQRGARINAITNELKLGRTEEKIDVIPWNENIETFIAKSIGPAEAVEVKIINKDEKQALILVPDESLSLAIGREGQNVRLAAKLTGWRLDIQGVKGYEDNGKKSKFELGDDFVPAKKPAKTESKAETEEQAPDTESNSGLRALQLSARTEKALLAAGVQDIETLKSKLDAGEKIAGVGPKAVEEITAALK